MLQSLEIQTRHAKNIVVDNDFHQTHTIFSLFERLEVEDLDKPLVNGNQTNGVHNHIANGVPKEVHI